MRCFQGTFFPLAVMFRIHWKQNASVISARLLRESLSYSRFFGVLLFRFGNDKDGLVILDDTRKWWKWFILLHRIMTIFGIYFGISAIFDGFSNILHTALQFGRLVLLLVGNFWIIRQQFFRNKQAIFLANKMLKLFRQVRCLRNQEKVGFGDERELVLIVLIMGCRIFEFVCIIALFFGPFELRTIYTFWCMAYMISYMSLLRHFIYLWYLALGVLYSDLNKLLKNEVNNSIRPNIGKYLDIYQKVHKSSILFKSIFNNQLFFTVLSGSIYVADALNLMIRDLSLGHPWVWASFVKIIIEYQLFCSAVERIIEECDKTRLIVFEASIVKNTKESNKGVEMFITFLNLNPFSLQLFGLFEISNSFYLKMLSDTINYVIVVVQFIFQTNQMQPSG
ncbi:hypothetical protein KR026_005737 [Drosophila bipectinata]|nr:hypothetical protein KR026_005737 [Drosophila bipectinata]